MPGSGCAPDSHCPLHPLAPPLSLPLSVFPQLTFEAAAERVKTLKDKPANDTLLKLYGLFKQATVGDNTAAQPWQVQMEARAKWDAWTAQKGKSQDAAKAEYVTLVESLAAADK